MAKGDEKQRVAEEVQQTLRHHILSGKYPPGSKLPPERELAKRLGVNRASLREALKKLEHLGLVRARQGDGTRVTNYMETAGIELVSYLLPLAASSDSAIVRDILEFRAITGREVARLAAERRTEDDLAALEALAARAAAPGLPAPAIFDVDFEIYAALTIAGKNRVVGMLVNTVRKAVGQYRELLAHLIVSPERVQAHHRAVIDAVRARDPEAAARAADEYLRAGADHALGMLPREMR